MGITNSSYNNNKKNNITFSLFLLLSTLLPWPNGLELQWQFLLFTGSILSIMSLFLIENMTKNTLWNSLEGYKLSFYLFVLLIIYTLLQTSPLPYNLVTWLSPNSIVLNSADLTTFNMQKPYATLSVDPETTFLELLKNISYLVCFIFCLCALNTPNKIVKLVNTLFFSSVIIALYSLVNHYTHGAFSIVESISPWTIPWKLAAHGTFSYQNHYASFLLMTIPLGFGIMHYNYKSQQSNGVSSQLIAKVLNILLSKQIIYIFSLIIMMLALLKTSSRGGNLLFIISFIFTYISFIFVNKSYKVINIKKNLTYIGVGLILGLFILGAGITDKLVKRYEMQGFEPSGRDIMYSTVHDIVTDFPLFGSGSGTYPVIQHKYKSPDLGNTAMSKRAHNDYLELLANLGLVGFSLLFAAMFFLYKKLIVSLRKTNSNLLGIQVAAVTGVNGILLHSTIDFNLHLPANTIYFFIVLAIGLKAPLLRSKVSRLNHI